LALHHQFDRVGPSAHSLLDNYLVARAQERLFTIHGIGR